MVYISSFIISFYTNKNNNASINTTYYKKDKKSFDIKEYDKLTNSKAFERFKYITINNEKVIILNYCGALSLGLCSVALAALNGITFGNYIGVYSNYVSLYDILKYTLPHSFELLAIIFSSGEGFFLGTSLFLCLLGYKKVNNINFMKAAIHFIYCSIIILLAAFVEAYITMSL